MGLDDAIKGAGDQMALKRAAYNEQNADRLREERAEAEALQAFDDVVSTQIMPVFNRAAEQLDGAWVESLYGRDIQLAVKVDATHGKYSINYMFVGDGRVVAAKLAMDGNGTPFGDSPVLLSELTQKKVEAHVEDFLIWYRGIIGGS